MTRSFRRRFYELMSSMRFAISLLTILAIASIIGTVLKQNEPYNNYLNQFGQFWFPIFESLGLYSVYHAAWFLAILTFLVISTSLCIIRQGPQMVREMKSYRTHAKENSLRLFAHSSSVHTHMPRAEAVTRLNDYLLNQGYRGRADQRTDELLLAAKAGSWNRMGYLLAHSAIVMICLGGLLDGDLPLKLEMLIGHKQVTQANQVLANIGPDSRLGPEHWSYRGNVFLPEGKSSNIALINVADGVLLQELPFIITLKKFYVEHYSTGAPKRFASEITLTDPATGKAFDRTIEVNKPFEYQGVTLYQASFDDGGTQLALKAHSLLPGSSAFSTAKTAVGDTLNLTQGGVSTTLEFTGFRPFNVENMADEKVAANNSTLSALNKHLGSGARAAGDKAFQNVGPSFSFKVRDNAGQAREYNNYMAPIEQDGRYFFMTGMRDAAASQFRYLRLPADEKMQADTWFAIRALISNPLEHAQIARRFANMAMHGDAVSQTMRTRLADTATRTLQIFSKSGFEGLGKFITDTVPEAEREKAADVFVRVLQGCFWEAWQLSRERQKLAVLDMNPARADFIRDTVNSVSDSFHYGAPIYLELEHYDEVKASVIQATRSPGRNIVYLGSALLVAGVFFMLYVRERRCFALIKDDGEVLLAFSANRKALDVDAEFVRHQAAMTALLQPDTENGTRSDQIST